MVEFRSPEKPDLTGSALLMSHAQDEFFKHLKLKIFIPVRDQLPASAQCTTPIPRLALNTLWGFVWQVLMSKQGC